MGCSKSAVKSVILSQERVLYHFKIAPLGLPCSWGPFEVVRVPLAVLLFIKKS